MATVLWIKAWRKGSAFELQLTGLDLGKVEDVVDDFQQRDVRDLHHLDVAALLLRQPAGARQKIDEAADAGQGVRIS